MHRAHPRSDSRPFVTQWSKFLEVERDNVSAWQVRTARAPPDPHASESFSLCAEMEGERAAGESSRGAEAGRQLMRTCGNVQADS